MQSKDNSPPKKNRTNDGVFFIFHSPPLEELYYSICENKQWVEVQRLLNDKRHTVKATDITYRSINHWTEQGLLDDHRTENSKWRKLSFKDLIWLRILTELRKFGLPLDKLKETYKTLAPTRSLKFETGLSLCFHRPATPMFIVVFDDGSADIASLHSLRVTEYMVGYELPYIRINLNTLCCEIMGNDEIMPPRLNPLDSLSSDEIEVIKALSEKGADEIRIRLKNGSINEIERTQKHDSAERISELMREMNFGQITVKVENGKPAHTVSTKKKKVTT